MVVLVIMLVILVGLHLVWYVIPLVYVITVWSSEQVQCLLVLLMVLGLVLVVVVRHLYYA